MIKANHARWANLLFDPYLNGILKKDFSHFFISNYPKGLADADGILLTPNHISWWDGFFIYWAMKRFTGRKIFLMMLEEQLSKHRFFHRMGAFSIDPGKRDGVMESLDYAASLLGRKDAYVVMYPQGEIRPQYGSRIEIMKGLKYLLKKSEKNASLMPITFLAEPYNERHPELWCRFGPLISVEDAGNDFSGYEDIINEERDLLLKSIDKREYVKDLFGRVKASPV